MAKKTRILGSVLILAVCSWFASMGLRAARDVTIELTKYAQVRSGKPAELQFAMREVKSASFKIFDITDKVREWDRNRLVLNNGDFGAPDKSWAGKITEGDTGKIGFGALSSQVAGLYLMEAATVDAENKTLKIQEVFAVTDFELQLKTSRNKLLVYVLDCQTRQPVADARVQVSIAKLGHNVTRVEKGKEIVRYLKEEYYGPNLAEGKTNQDGFFLWSFDDIKSPKKDYNLEKLQVRVRKGHNFTYAFFSYGRVAPSTQGYIYTDRPVYRPGQQMHFKGIFRRSDPENYQVLANQDIDLTILDSKSNPLYREKIRTNSLGSLSGSFQLGGEPPTGYYAIRGTVDGNEVAENYFRVMSYRKPTFTAAVTTDQKEYLKGDTVKATVNCRYIFGEAASGAKVEFDGGKLGKKYARTDENGMAAVEFNTGKSKADGNKISASVTDLSGENIRTEANVTVHHRLLSIKLTAPGRPCTGRENKVTIRVRDWQRQPAAAEVIFLSEYRKNYRGSRERLGIKRIKIDDSGEAEFSFTPENGGYYFFNASTLDEWGNNISADIRVQISGPVKDGEKQFWMGLEPRKGGYKIGDTCRLNVFWPHDDTAALLSLEGMNIYSYQTVKLVKGEQELTLPVTEEWAPNINVLLGAYEKNKTVIKSQNVKVPATHKSLAIDVKTDRDEYLPREAVSFQISVTDSQGKPVQAELSAALIDEAIYEVERDRCDIHRNFYSNRSHNVAGADSSFVSTISFFYQVFEDDDGIFELCESEIWIGGGSGGFFGGRFGGKSDRVRGGGACMSSERQYEGVCTRKNFRDTAYWQPVILTDKEGKTVVNVTLPDNITTWRFTARGHTGDSRFGKGICHKTVKQDMFIKTFAPMALTQFDRFEFAAAIHNLTGTDLPGKVMVAVSGAQLIGDAVRELNITSGNPTRAAWELHVDQPGKVTISVKCLAGDFADAVEIVIPVQAHASREILGQAGRIYNDSAGLQFEIPDNLVDEESNLEISLSPTVLAPAFEALDYLLEYPHGCVEQTMNRFMPAVLIAGVTSKIQRQNPALDDKLNRVIDHGLQRLYGFQKNDGSWGWWGTGSAKSAWISAYVFHGLVATREAGYHVSQKSIDKAANYLLQCIDHKKNNDQTAYVIYSLSYSGRNILDDYKLLFEKRDSLSEYSKALLALAAQRLGLAEENKVLCRQLRQYVVSNDEFAYWKASGRGHSWQDSSIETTAYCLAALLGDAGQDDELLEKCIRWLMKERRGMHWKSTKDTAVALFALARYIASRPGLNVPFKATVIVNGTEHTVTGTDAVSGAKFNVSGAELRRGGNNVTVKTNAETPLYYRFSLTKTVLEKEFKPAAHGLSINRRYEILQAGENRDGQYKVTRIPARGNVALGDMVEVTLEIQAGEKTSFVIIEDYLPSGFRIVSPNKPSGFDRMDVYDSKVCFFTSHLREGLTVLKYKCFAEIAGDYKVLPVQAGAMYQPSINCRSAGNILSVLE
ncbi:alpha-2-macroglobulin [Planctomycetota bacterium]